MSRDLMVGDYVTSHGCDITINYADIHVARGWCHPCHQPHWLSQPMSRHWQLTGERECLRSRDIASGAPR